MKAIRIGWHYLAGARRPARFGGHLKMPRTTRGLHAAIWNCETDEQRPHYHTDASTALDCAGRQAYLLGLYPGISVEEGQQIVRDLGYGEMGVPL